jgi:hypothetical protein
MTAPALAKKLSSPDLGPLLESLTLSGHVTKLAAARSVKFAIPTEVATALAALAPVAPPKAARSPSAATTALSSALTSLEQRLLSALLPRLERIERALGASPSSASNPAQTPPGASAPPAPARSVSDDDLLALVHQVGDRAHAGALVPLGKLRAEASARSGIDRATFDQRVLALERAFLLDLKVADDPRRPDAADGIDVPGRGLVFFAVDRRA